jgi:small multidrug resistance family-3 protein
MVKGKKKIGFGLIGGIILFLYGIIPTFQPSNFGRVYAAYGGIFVMMAIIWGLIMDKKDLINMKSLTGLLFS